MKPIQHCISTSIREKEKRIDLERKAEKLSGGKTKTQNEKTEKGVRLLVGGVEYTSWNGKLRLQKPCKDSGDLSSHKVRRPRTNPHYEAKKLKGSPVHEIKTSNPGLEAQRSSEEAY